MLDYDWIFALACAAGVGAIAGASWMGWTSWRGGRSTARGKLLHWIVCAIAAWMAGSGVALLVCAWAAKPDAMRGHPMWWLPLALSLGTWVGSFAALGAVAFVNDRLDP